MKMILIFLAIPLILATIEVYVHQYQTEKPNFNHCFSNKDTEACIVKEAFKALNDPYYASINLGTPKQNLKMYFHTMDEVNFYITNRKLGLKIIET